MSLVSLLRKWIPTGAAKGRTPRPATRLRPRLEALEERMALSTFNAATASDLVTDIQAANQAGGANTILLTAPAASSYITSGATALPVIAAGDQLTIQTSNGTPNPGFGDTIDAAQNGRLFTVAVGASLTLENVTLQNGRVSGLGAGPKGGAVYNQGNLVLSDVMVQHNTVAGWPSARQDAAGGGVWSSGSLTVENGCVFRGNTAVGSSQGLGPGNGGNAFGGAVCVAAGSAVITGSNFTGLGYNNSLPNDANSALGGQAGSGYHGGSAYGGAVCITGGAVTMSGDVIGCPPGGTGNESNTAKGAYGGGSYGGGVCVTGGTATLTNDTVYYNQAVANSGPAHGSGIYIAPGVTVDLDASTVADTVFNARDNIYGMYTLLS